LGFLVCYQVAIEMRARVESSGRNNLGKNLSKEVLFVRSFGKPNLTRLLSNKLRFSQVLSP